VRSIMQLTQSKAVKAIVLASSEDLRCVNLFCEKVGGPCVCRIERVLARDDLSKSVEHLDLSLNKLTQLPPSLFKLNHLKTLVLRDNDLATLKAEDFSTLESLETVDLSNNPLSDQEAFAQQLQKILPSTSIILGRVE
jgi:Leucine-rich repeat (LRR) protein